MNAFTNFDHCVAFVRDRTPIHDFVEQYQSALCHAAHVLGGAQAVQELDRLFGDLSREGTIGLHARRRIDRIIGLFEQDDDNEYDDQKPMFIELPDAIVAEICVLVDGLKDALRQSVCPHAS